MATDEGIKTAADGVDEVAMTFARANLTQLLRNVRYGKRTSAFTERGERSAYVVPPEFYEEAARNREVLEQLQGMVGLSAGASAETSPDQLQRSRIVYEALVSAGLPLDP